MLPFLKNKQEASMASDPDDAEGFSTLDAVCDDMFQAIDKKDKGLFKSALEALCDYIRAEDLEQDGQ